MTLRNVVVDYITSFVSDIQNDHLMGPFNLEDIRDAVFSMHPDKSPGVDGFNLGFYRHF